jgi:hypothetical protein
MSNRRKVSRQVKMVVLFFMLLMAYKGFGQSEKMYVVINEASWCKYCKLHGERVNKVIEEFSTGKEILVLHHDVTDKSTTKKIDATLKSLGIYDYTSHHTEAAMVYVFNSKTKKIIDGFRLKSEDVHIKEVLVNSLKKINQ